MKKFKQAAAFVAAASMVVASLAGCGSKNAGTTETKAAESAEGAAWKIGGIGPVSYTHLTLPTTPYV